MQILAGNFVIDTPQKLKHKLEMVILFSFCSCVDTVSISFMLMFTFLTCVWFFDPSCHCNFLDKFISFYLCTLLILCIILVDALQSISGFYLCMKIYLVNFILLAFILNYFYPWRLKPLEKLRLQQSCWRMILGHRYSLSMLLSVILDIASADISWQHVCRKERPLCQMQTHIFVTYLIILFIQYSIHTVGNILWMCLL